MQFAPIPISPRYRGAIFASLLQQVPCALLTLLMLDFGRIARVCGITMIGFWVAVALILLQRPMNPASSDLAFVRWGFLPLFVLANTFDHVIWR